MNKTTYQVITTVLVILLFLPCFLMAQDYKEPNVVVITKWTRDYQEGYRITGLDSLLTLFVENVVKKNKYVVSDMTLQHFYGSDSRDFYIITEYDGSTLDVIDKAGDEFDRLFNEWLTTPEERSAYNDLWFKYFKNHHSDEILTTFTVLKK